MKTTIFTLACLASAIATCSVPQTLYADFGSAWREIMQKSRAGQGIEIATTMKAEPACVDAPQLLDAVPHAIVAMNSKRYGDYVNVLATFQRRLLCLNAKSVRTIDALLAAYLAGATGSMSAPEARKVRRGLFNLGLLTFDQLQSSGASFWWQIIAMRENEYKEILRQYPAKELGIFAYDVRFGELKRIRLNNAAELMLDALMRSEDLFSKHCYIGDMVQKSKKKKHGIKTNIDASLLQCGSNDSPSGADSNNIGKSNIPSRMSCLVAVVNSTGVRGQISCVRKVFDSLGPDVRNPRPGEADLKGVPDRMCALSQPDGGTAPKNDDKTAIDMESEKNVLEKLWDSVKDAVLPEPLSLAEKFASEEAAVTSGTVLKVQQEAWFKDHLADIPAERVAEEREKWNNMTTEERQKFIKETNATKPKGRPVVDGPTTGDPCSDPTGAYARTQAAYQCLMGEAIRGRTAPSGPPGPRPSMRGGAIGLSVNPEHEEFQPSAAMSCFMQGGENIRLNVVDSRCAVARCADPDNCTCNGKSNVDDVNLAAAQHRREIECQSISYCDGECPPCSTAGGGTFTGLKQIKGVPTFTGGLPPSGGGLPRGGLQPPGTGIPGVRPDP